MSSARCMLQKVSNFPSRWIASRRICRVGGFLCKSVGCRLQNRAQRTLDSIPIGCKALASTPLSLHNRHPVHVSYNSGGSILSGNLRAASNVVAGPSTGSDGGHETMPAQLPGRVIHREAVIKCPGITAVSSHCGSISLQTPSSTVFFSQLHE